MINTASVELGVVSINDSLRAGKDVVVPAEMMLSCLWCFYAGVHHEADSDIVSVELQQVIAVGQKLHAVWPPTRGT